MKALLARLTAALFSLLMLVLPAYAGQLDDYYLSQFSAQSNQNQLQKAVLSLASDGGESPHCGTPLKHKLRQDWDKLEPATQKVLAKQLAAPVLSGPESTLWSPTGKFKIHYTISGADAVPSIPWVQTVAQTFDDVAAAYTARGWRLAPTVAGAPYDVYMLDLAPQRLYGQTTTAQSIPSAGFSNAYGSYMEIDNNFTDALYGPYTATQSLQITAAHEYHHAIQYGYNVFFDIWYAEATSSWHEDELYDGVNQIYNYLPGWFNNSTLALDTATSTTTGGGYGRWIFNRYLAEQHGTAFIRTAWEKLAPMNSPGGNADIPMAPVLDNLLISTPYSTSLGSDFSGFVKRVYLRDWTSHVADISIIHPYSPSATLSSYPATSSITLAHYSFAFFKFTPSATVSTLNLNLSKTSAIRTALFKKSGNSTPTEITANSDGSYTVSGFGSLNPATDEIVLMVVNSSAADNHQASFNTGGSAPAVAEPVISTGGGGGGGSSGCFIATAAYGSYLHPQVRLLRNFRDQHLLTNAPGRAFVALYYRLSPPLAEFIAGNELLRAMTRLALLPFIAAVAHPALAAVALLLLFGGSYRLFRRRTRLCESSS